MAGKGVMGAREKTVGRLFGGGRMGCVARSPVDEHLELLDPIGDLLRLLKEC